MPWLPDVPLSRRSWRSPRGARYAQAIVVGAIAIALIAALATAASVVESALRTVASGEGERLLHAVRPVIDRNGPDDVALAGVIEARSLDGLRCVALFDGAGHVTKRVGECLASDSALAALLVASHPGEVLRVGRHMVFVHQLPPRRPPPPDRQGAPPPPGPPPDAAWPPPDAPWPPPDDGRLPPPHRPPGPPPGALRGPPGHPPDAPPGALPFLIEFVAVQAEALRRAAMRSVIAGFVATGALLVATLVFWRLSSRAEALQRTAERDRRLASLGEMSAVLAHEIRNPLASLKGHAQLLLESLGARDGGRPDAEWVVRESVRLEELCEDLLSLVRSTKIAPQDVDPAALLREAADGLGEARIAIDAGAAPARWRLDPVRMHQVLGNLLRNALQASDDGRAAVAASVGVEHGALIFAVRDHGPGVADGDAERIFEPFHTTKTRGTGLGLAVARRIVEQHGGTITVRNHAQGGAEFRVRLPRAARA
ncbi:MAG: ATP-binding protein [bacterium]